ncbi:pentatricopeptide repeat-containing protein [Hibiscus syriacus]|uniref:Pentatricopeptide repeat-containing protein n=1 Tax=Hibiscus syriacus TaxID=106335 RepID=A0A6A3BYY3_HIBSY|nr:pentatricopeptide repeat-containing protein At4g18975, chloroplastic [Hibiscus syriacus]KAE8721935.1 pentatricopeptide repeat-containing protein [Hibiscus syriacus]
MLRVAIQRISGRSTPMIFLPATSALLRGCSYATYDQVIPKGQGKIAHSGHVVKDQCNNQTVNLYPKPNVGGEQKHQIGQNVSRKDKIKFLVTTLLDITDSKEAVYGTLDTWVAWEQSFPIGPLKNVILALEKEHQWHRVVQVIKWMLSKGQGNTMGTYTQLLRALDRDNRAEEAHQFWVKKVGADLHSVPWQLCRLMIAVYYRNNMLENLVKLFKGLESFGRKPPEQSIVQRVADAYEMLGLVEERKRVLEKYKDICTKTEKERKKSKQASLKKKKNSGRGRSRQRQTSASDNLAGTINGSESER